MPLARKVLPSAAIILALLAGWQIYVEVSDIRPQVLPSPERVFREGWEQRDDLWRHTRATLRATAIGFSISVAVAVLLAIVIDFSATLRRALYPLLVFSQTLPIFAIAPLLIIWFGFDLTPKVLVVALVTFFPITVALADGFNSSDPEAANLLRSMGASRRQVFRYIRLPSAMPSFFSGLRISITYAVIAAVFAEFVGAREGLGIYMQQQRNSLRTDLVLAAVLVTAGLSILLFAGTYLVQRLTIPWYHASRRQG
jgi:ABC-type nitrate/sulfonate/bicarbonate transport system permease component